MKDLHALYCSYLARTYVILVNTTEKRLNLEAARDHAEICKEVIFHYQVTSSYIRL